MNKIETALVGIAIAVILIGSVATAHYLNVHATVRVEAFSDVLSYIETSGYVVAPGNLPKVNTGTLGYSSSHRLYCWYRVGISYSDIHAFLNDYAANCNGSLFYDDAAYIRGMTVYLVVWFIDCNGVIVCLHS